MKRAERNEYNYIRRYEKQFELSYGIHPAGLRVDSRMYDDRERIIYIYGLTYDLHGEARPWTDLYTEEEKARYAAALD